MHTYVSITLDSATFVPKWTLTSTGAQATTHINVIPPDIAPHPGVGAIGTWPAPSWGVLFAWGTTPPPVGTHE